MSGGRYGGYESGSSSRRPSSWDSDGCTKVYVGNLGPEADKGEVARAFSYYGPLNSVWIARNPPGFAFVEFEDPRDAEDAVIGLDGKRVICGSRVRVELSAGRTRRGGFGRLPGRGGFNPSDRCYECGERGHYAYDCDRLGNRRRNAISRSRSRSRSGGRRRSRSRGRGRKTRSPSPRRRTRSPSSRKRTRTRSPSPRRRTRSASPSRKSRSPSNKSVSRGRGEPASKSRSRSTTPKD